jgi:hypothetical protein
MDRLSAATAAGIMTNITNSVNVYLSEVIAIVVSEGFVTLFVVIMIVDAIIIVVTVITRVRKRVIIFLIRLFVITLVLDVLETLETLLLLLGGVQGDHLEVAATRLALDAADEVLQALTLHRHHRRDGSRALTERTRTSTTLKMEESSKLSGEVISGAELQLIVNVANAHHCAEFVVVLGKDISANSLVKARIVEFVQEELGNVNKLWTGVGGENTI